MNQGEAGKTRGQVDTGLQTEKRMTEQAAKIKAARTKARAAQSEAVEEEGDEAANVQELPLPEQQLQPIRGRFDDNKTNFAG